MENTLRDAIDTIRNLAADVNPERDSPQSPSSPPISNSTQIHFFEYREPDHQTKTRIGAYLPERDGIQLRINPQAGKEIEGGMVWYPTKGFIPADADPTKFPDLSWTERENAATPKPEELHIRDDATGYIQVDASWATKQIVRKIPVQYTFGNEGEQQKGEPIMEIEGVEWINTVEAGENPWKLQTFPTPTDTLQGILKEAGTQIKNAEPILFQSPENPVGRPREQRVFLAQRTNGVDAGSTGDVDLNNRAEQIKITPDGGLLQGYVFSAENETVGSVGNRVAKALGGDLSAVQLITHGLALIGAREFLENDVLNLSQFRREVPQNLGVDRIPNRSDLLIVYEGNVSELNDAYKNLEIGVVGAEDKSAGSLISLDVFKLFSAGGSSGGEGEGVRLSSKVSPIVSQRKTGNRVVLEQADGHQRTNFDDGRVRLDYPDGGRMLKKGRIGKQIFPDELGQIAAKMKEGEEQEVVFVEELEKIPDGVEGERVEELKKELVKFLRGAEDADEEMEIGGEVEDGPAVPVVPVVLGGNVTRHTMLENGELYGGGNRDVVAGNGEVVVECTFVHNYQGKPNIYSDGVRLMAVTRNYGADGDEYAEQYVVVEDMKVSEFREAMVDKVRSARHRGGAFLGVSVQLVSGRGIGLGDFEGVGDAETMGDIVNGNRGIMRVLVNLDTTGTTYAKNASLSVDMDADGNMYMDEVDE